MSLRPQLFLVTCALLACSSLFSQPTRVYVDAHEVIRSINPWLYGINTARWDESLFPGPTNEMLTTADRDAIGKIKSSGITLLKYPGGNDADQYVWNSAANNVSEMNTDEYIALCRAVGAEPFITVNFNEPPELAAAWIRYCNSEMGYNVKLWEVGDEQWGTWARGHVPPEEYAKKYIAFVKAMKAADPSIKVATNVPLGAHPENWAERVVKAAGDYMNMITFTYFPQLSGKENDDTLMTSVGKFRDLFRQLRKDVDKAAGAKKAASILYINVGYNSVTHSPGPQTLEVINALWTGDMLGSMAEVGTDIACFWALHNFYPPRGGDFGYLSSEGSNTPRYSYYVFPMFTRNLEGSMLRTICGNPSISAYASKSGKKLSILFINKDRRKSMDIDVELANFEPQNRAQVWLLDVKRKDSRMPDLSSVSNSFPVKLPPYSITALEMIGRDSIVPPTNLAQQALASASSYSTIGPDFKPSSTIDGKMSTRWNSAAWTKSNGQETQWFQLSWKTPQRIKRVKICWGETYATDYVLEASSDGKSWKRLREVNNGAGGTEEYEFPLTKASFLKIDGKKGTKGISAYSIREIAVYGE